MILTVPDFSTVANDSVAGYGTGWSDVSGQPVRWYKDGLSRVHIEGQAQHAGPTLPDTLFTLKSGSRPSNKQTFWHNDHVIDVEADGDVVLVSGTSPTTTNLTGISFLAEA